MSTHTLLRAVGVGVAMAAVGACAATTDHARAPEPVDQPVIQAAAQLTSAPAPAEPETTAGDEAEPAKATPPTRSGRRNTAQQGMDDEMAEALRRRRARTQAEPDAPGAQSAPLENVLLDAGFEEHLRWDDGQPWWNPLQRQNSKAWVEFEVVEDVARTGERSALLHMDSDTQPGGTRVHGVVQEHAPATFPRYISGWYRVENWQRGAIKQYLQAVVIARKPVNTPRGFPSGRMGPSVQLAMTLAGIEFPPLVMGNRRFEVTGPEEPVQDEWVFFEFDLHELYEKHWSMVPEGSEAVRVFFEVRYDSRSDGPAARADVYFDDLYLGDESRASDADAGEG